MIYHYRPQHPLEELLWEETHLDPFQELIVSWNAKRPQKGSYTFWVSVKQNQQWSAWICYAQWGHDDQRTFQQSQDVLQVEGAPATGFRIKVVIEGEVKYDDIAALHANTKSLRLLQHDLSHRESIMLPIDPISQLQNS